MAEHLSATIKQQTRAALQRGNSPVPLLSSYSSFALVIAEAAMVIEMRDAIVRCAEDSEFNRSIQRRVS